ncbi:MAG: ABC transporter permease [Candidatus Limnocylindria bacterium]
MTAAADVATILRRRGPGWQVVARKELAETLTSVRFAVLVVLLGLAATAPVYAASGAIRDAAEQASGASAIFLALFTYAQDPIPSFTALVGFLAPLLGIGFGFDAVNDERAQRTLPRLLSQPIYRDDVVNGKFAAGLLAIATTVVALTMLVAGLGLVRLGIVPAPVEVVRMVVWLIVTILYVGIWLAFAMLCSVVLARPAASALVALGVWLGLTVFGALVASIVAGALSPAGTDAGLPEQLANAQLQQLLSSISPNTLYQQASAGILSPGVTTLGVPSGIGELLQASQQIPTRLSLDQSLLLVWPQVVVLFGVLAGLFAAAYASFLRQEVRA